ncbi:MAG: hypothetical protein KC776_27435 [Myxococcales bacterium]|nr:hypothetical protein [Myxococcales bacterium]MCB9577780.1 hypothetical protein [Polyangiaceae bacterium]
MDATVGAIYSGAAERRSDRSTDALGALCRMLDAARREGAVEALAVADETGVLVAGSGFWETCEELAALAPLLPADEPANDVVPTRLDVLSRRTEVRRLSIDGVSVLVCGAGDGAQLDAALVRVAGGCARILGRSRLA